MINDMTDAERQPIQGQPIRQRNRRGRYLPSPDTAERDAAIYRDYIRGRPTQYELAAKYGIDQSSVSDAIKRAQTAARAARTSDDLGEALKACDEMQAEVRKVLDTAHVTVNAKGVVYVGDGDDYRPLEDDSPLMAAVDRWLAIEKHRAQLLGTLAPAKKQIEVRSVTRFDESVSGLLAEFDARDAQRAPEPRAATAESGSSRPS